MKRLTAPVPPTPGKTRHFIVNKSGSTPCEHPATLVIEERDGAFFLLRLSSDGGFVADTWHLTLEEALEQARHEYGIEEAEWTSAAEEPKT
ncbi:MAG: hypothetical protein AAF533_17685 [Acidobacteriota bacterium]